MENRQIFQDKKILIVDDEEDLREIISFEFELVGFNISVAENGRKAFQTYQQEKPDVILSDIRMPGGDGLELLKRIKSENPFHPPVLLMTGFADLSDEEAYLLGADYIFSKPFDSADLLQGVANMLMPFAERMKKGPSQAADIHLDLELPSFEKSIDDHLLAVGRTGLFVHTQQAQKVGTAIEINIKFAEGDLKDIRAQGIVRWSRLGQKGARKQGLGIELTGLNEEATTALNKYIEAQRPQASIPCG